MKRILALALAALACAANASAEVVTVFGLPLGGKVPAFKNCTFNEIGRRDVKCVFDRTALPSLPTRSMNLQLPDAEVPTWVIGSLHLTIDKKTNEIDEIRVRSESSLDSSLMASAVASIASRFGPVSNLLGDPRSPLYKGLWLPANDLRIEISGTPNNVLAVFRTKRAVDRHNNYVRDQEAKRAQQPRSP